MDATTSEVKTEGTETEKKKPGRPAKEKGPHVRTVPNRVRFAVDSLAFAGIPRADTAMMGDHAIVRQRFAKGNAIGYFRCVTCAWEGAPSAKDNTNTIALEHCANEPIPGPGQEKVDYEMSLERIAELYSQYWGEDTTPQERIAAERAKKKAEDEEKKKAEAAAAKAAKDAKDAEKKDAEKKEPEASGPTAEQLASEQVPESEILGESTSSETGEPTGDGDLDLATLAHEGLV